MTEQDVAALMQVSKRTVQRWRYTKQLPFIKVRGTIRFNPRDLDVWMAKHRKQIK